VAGNRQHIASYVLENARPGSIILLHVMYGQKESVEAISSFVPELKRRGYRFVTVSELLAFEKRR
jgi:peptidoglycan/xylan/chitin deacetylase (PgdA/CDA1 family)